MRKMLSTKAGATFSLDCPQFSYAMRKKMLAIYNELVMNPPFPAWKSGLDDVWE